jgi:hypothetical protein
MTGAGSAETGAAVKRHVTAASKETPAAAKAAIPNLRSGRRAG